MWESSFDRDGDLFVHTQGLIALRKDLEPLRRGDYNTRWASDRVGAEEDAGIYAFERATETQVALVVLNVNDDHSSHTAFEGSGMPVSFSPGTTLVEVWPEGSERTFTVAGDGTVVVDVVPRGGSVLVAR